MNNYQKSATLVFRLLAMMLVLYSIFTITNTLLVVSLENGKDPLILNLRHLFAGIILFFLSTPLAKICSFELK